MSTNDFALRFVAYQPDGVSLGVLPDVFDYNFSTIVNEVPSLTFKYSRLGIRSGLLDNPIEVAVEWYDGTSWREAANSRFIKVEASEDETDETATVSYTFPGYGWMLGKAIMRAGLNRNPDNQKRTWSEQSPGSVMGTLIDEAHSRGNIPGLVAGFTANTDSNGQPWQFQRLALELDRGTTLDAVLKLLSDQGRCDWRMAGRTLQIFNPESNSISAAHVQATRSETVIDLGAVVTDWKGNVDGDVSNGQVPDSYRGGLESDIAAFCAQGDPLFTESGMTAVNGTRSSSSAGIGVLRSRRGPDANNVTRSFGAVIADWSSLPRYVLGVPDMTGGSDTDLGVEENAVWTYLAMPGGVISLPGTGPVMYGNVTDGFHCHARALMSRGLPYIEFADFPDTSADNADIILQLGVARTAGGVIRMNALKAALPSAWRVVIDYASIDPNQNNEDWWLIGPPDLKNDDKPSEGRQDPDVVIGGVGYKATLRDGEMRSLTNLRSAEARRWGVPYMRILMKRSWTGQTGLSQQLAAGIASAFAGLPTRIPKAGRRGNQTGSTPTYPNASVTVFNGRDAVEAPAQSSIADFARRVYVFGDPVLETVLTNDLAPAPWGAWEVGIGQGGAYEQTSLQAMAQYALDAGSYMKVSRTRQSAVNECPFVPYRDYEPGDYVLTNLRDGSRLVARVQQISITVESEGSPMASITLGDRFIEPELLAIGAIKSAAAGNYPPKGTTAGATASGGTGTSAANADPGTTTVANDGNLQSYNGSSNAGWCSPTCDCRSGDGGGTGLVPGQVFTEDGTWIKPASGSTVTITCIGGGGGGASGQVYGNVSNGGGGGGGGGRTSITLRMSDLPGTVPVHVGTGGAGANHGPRGDTFDGGQGGQGLASYFGINSDPFYVIAGGGFGGGIFGGTTGYRAPGGNGGTAVGQSGGAGGYSPLMPQGTSRTEESPDKSAVKPSEECFAGAGGGGGGAVERIGAQEGQYGYYSGNGAAGGASTSPQGGTVCQGGQGGFGRGTTQTGGSTGTSGNNNGTIGGSQASPNAWGGGGGGGGGGSGSGYFADGFTYDGGNGAPAGDYGAGGGGGGGAIFPHVSGKGGKGGAGMVIITVNI